MYKQKNSGGGIGAIVVLVFFIFLINHLDIRTTRPELNPNKNIKIYSKVMHDRDSTQWIEELKHEQYIDSINNTIINKK